MRGRRCEESVLREIWLERTQLGTKTAAVRLLRDIPMSAAPYRSPGCSGMVSIGPSWGVLRFAEHSAAFRMTIMDIFDLKKLDLCLV
ncbi:MAG: hypothetical protein DMG76_37515 [Acidobacteria bacterium]|nr:MAG: hypothetical protein DMG76_37515 [Acidobacteriota bacterium]